VPVEERVVGGAADLPLTASLNAVGSTKSFGCVEVGAKGDRVATLFAARG
jgi:hypothetical protein